ncbi:hypothetical protein MKK69_22810 [Methylobacterium sp. J-026]|uniref:hypothetical protein n=1 Tax=Methylobacterium sp. J-026 TaxID=2836624 RepID=UPI001FBA3A96|nr:hypothetical protein [Methylobacterium sp. J-026]MCJ2136847.1 hypothetical protein [Methylobacterium sp. J-026]
MSGLAHRATESRPAACGQDLPLQAAASRHERTSARRPVADVKLHEATCPASTIAVPAGTVQAASCAVQVWTTYQDLRTAGLQPELQFCRVASGEQHVIAVADGLALDQRFRTPIRVADMEFNK